MKEWLTGRNPVRESLRASRRKFFRLLVATGVEEDDRIRDIRRLSGQKKVPLIVAPRKEIDSLGEFNQGVALEAGDFPYTGLDQILARAARLNEAPFILILDTIQNPQNMGTLLRTAEAMGVHGAVIPLRRTVEVTPAVVTASAGAVEHMQICQGNLAQILNQLKEADVWILGLENRPDSRPIEETNLKGGIAVVVGNEGEGMRNLISKSCDFRVKLPLYGQVDSLNAAIAGSIVLYEIKKERQQQITKNI